MYLCKKFVDFGIGINLKNIKTQYVTLLYEKNC